MILQLLKHKWKEDFRSPAFDQGLPVKILMGFLGFMALCYLIAFGLLIDVILLKDNDTINPVTFINGYLVLYWIVGIGVRMTMQNTPAIGIQPYLLLPIRKSKVFNFLLARSFFSANNWLHLAFAIPFALKVVQKVNDFPSAIAWLIVFFSMSMANNYIVFILKKETLGKIWINWALMLLAAGLFGLNYYDLFPVNEISSAFMETVAATPLTALSTVVWAVLWYVLAFRYLKSKAYLENLAVKTDGGKGDNLNERLSFLRGFGRVGDIIALDLKMIMRNKRPKQVTIMAFAFLFYGLLFYTNDIYGKGMYVFCAVFITGLGMSNFGQFVPAWDSGHFDMLLTSNLSFKDYVRSKHRYMITLCSVFFVLSLPYGYFGMDIIWTHLSMALFNIGVSSYILLLFSTRNNRRFDITKSGSFNFEGTGATQWLASVPFLLLPQVLYWPITLLADNNTALITIGIIGVLGLALQSPILDRIAKMYVKQKYRLAEGLRA
ncbi:DUF5687 family protein [Fulvitalea axinellae]